MPRTITLFIVLGTLGVVLPIFSRPRPLYRIVGCYSDLSEIKDEGLIVGNGSFRITKNNGKYSATFTELISDGGEYAPAKFVKNLKVNERTGHIIFDLPLARVGGAKQIRNATGKVNNLGIHMNWRGSGGEFGQADPFMFRRSKHCQ